MSEWNGTQPSFRASETAHSRHSERVKRHTTVIPSEWNERGNLLRDNALCALCLLPLVGCEEMLRLRSAWHTKYHTLSMSHSECHPERSRGISYKSVDEIATSLTALAMTNIHNRHSERVKRAWESPTRQCAMYALSVATCRLWGDASTFLSMTRTRNTHTKVTLRMSSRA